MRAAWASLALEALERRFTCWSFQHVVQDCLRTSRRLGCEECKTDLIANTPPNVLHALANIGRVVICLVGILARGSQELLVRDLERLNTNFELYVVVRQFGLLGHVARLLFDPLLASGCKGRH